MDGWMGGWMDGWMDRKMDILNYVHHFIFVASKFCYFLKKTAKLV